MSITCRSTLDLKHKEQLGFFQNQRQNVKDMEQNLTALNGEYQILLEKRQNKTLTLDGFNKIQKMEFQIAKLQNEIEQIKLHKQEYQYLLKTSPIVHQYFDQIKHRTPSKEQTPKKDLQHLFKKSTVQKLPSMNRDKTCQRADLNDKYLAKIDSEYLAADTDTRDPYYCYECQRHKDIDRIEAKLICLGCGSFENETLDSDKPSYSKEQSQEISNFAYKRINHFNEILSQSQATENTDIPSDVYEMIQSEMKKERKYNLAELDFKTVKKYLKKHRSKGYNKYYEHIPHIINRMNGIPPLKFTPLQEEKLRSLFKKIQPAFDKHCPRTRNNFLSYNYILYKFCELLCYDDFLNNFPRLKSDNKLREQEEIWKKICMEMEFQFIPTL